MPAFTLLPQIGRRAGESALVHRRHEEVGGTPDGRPQRIVERLVRELAPGGLVGEQDTARLVDLMRTPRRGDSSVRPVALRPESLRLLRAGKPQQCTPRQLVATRREEREDEKGEVARPHESVSTRINATRIELGRRDHSPCLSVRERVEDEQRPLVQLCGTLSQGWCGIGDACCVDALTPFQDVAKRLVDGQGNGNRLYLAVRERSSAHQCGLRVVNDVLD